MDETPNLGLPYIMAAQSQKHVTHNEAIRALDALVQLSVLDRSLTTPPASPAEGARYIVAGSPAGAWSGHAGEVAAYQDGAWMFYAPVEGWIAWIADEDAAVVWNGTAWSALTTGGGGGGDGGFDTLAINGATADTTNRLSLNAPATLLNHDGNGHQLKVNKHAAADTASLLFQTGFSGRAEMGLAGDDDYHFKVSPDGATWKEAIVIDRSTGAVTFPFSSSAGGAAVARRNRIVNGALQISQENGNSAGTDDGYYLADQFSLHRVTSAGTIAAQRVQSATPGGARDRARVTISTADASLASGEHLYLRTRIEGASIADLRWGGASAKAVVLRFLFKGPAGTYALALTNAAASRTYVATFSPAAANTDEIITMAIPGDTSGTWLGDEASIGLEIRLTLACGATFRGAEGWQAGSYLGTSAVSNGMGTASAVFEFGEFGLYLDPDATGAAPAWELPDPAEELRRCRRYYYRRVKEQTNYDVLGMVSFFSSSLAWGGPMKLPVTMRAIPAVSISAAADFQIYAGADKTVSNIADWLATTDYAFIRSSANAGSGGAAGYAAMLYFNNTASLGAAWVAFNARL